LNEQAPEIERDGPTAVYQQLANHLLGLIDERNPGDRFPTEEELIEAFGLSRTTVRRSMQMIVDRGLVVRRQGKGTFVTGSRPIQSANTLAPFVESFTAAGIRPTVHLQTFSWLSSSDPLPEGLEGRGASFLLARRLYESDGTPLAVAEIYLPRHIGAEVTLADIEQHPIYQVLKERLGRDPRQARLRVTMQEPPEHIAALLDVAGLSHVARLERTTDDSSGEFLEYTMTHIHPDAFELVADVAAMVPSDISYTFDTGGGGVSP